eukprot:6180587-Pleurochrysis_carterae.AAC.1
MRTSYERLLHTNRRYGGSASVALRRIARDGPDSQNAARLRKIGDGMSSGTLGLPDLSFQLLVFVRASLVMTSFMCCLVRGSAKADGGQGADGQQRARALQIR